MTSVAAPNLDDLRRRIDAIDDGLLDLIQERAKIVGAVGAAKRAAGSAGAFRPGREAQVMRRLAARHQGPFGFATVVRLWREIMCEFTRLQGPFAVAVHLPDGRPGLWDLARDHFGGETPMAAHGSPAQVIEAVTDGAATVGVLPVPAGEGNGSWWTSLPSAGEDRPRIITRLPFASAGNARGPGLDAVAIARLPTEPSGEDRSYLAFDLAGPDASPDALRPLLRETGLPLCGLLRIGRAGLAEVDDYLGDDDPRLALLEKAAAGRLGRLRVLGAYAVPLSETRTA